MSALGGTRAGREGLKLADEIVARLAPIDQGDARRLIKLVRDLILGMITVDEVDRAIADRVRAARIDAGITLQQLANLIGVTCQQAHRYEAGINRIPGGRLFMIARALGCSVASLFPSDEAEPAVEAQKHPHAAREIANLLRPGMSNDRLEALLVVARALADTRPL